MKAVLVKTLFSFLRLFSILKSSNNLNRTSLVLFTFVIFLISSCEKEKDYVAFDNSIQQVESELTDNETIDSRTKDADVD